MSIGLGNHFPPHFYRHFFIMSKPIIEDQALKNEDFTKGFPSREFEYCRFQHCVFTATDLSHFRFVECTFDDCDFSNAKLTKTTLNGIYFVNCKLLGLHFEDCNEFLFSVSFENCLLDFSSFYKRSLKKTAFKQCSLQEVDFTDADLSAASFPHCNLTRAVFENTNLEKADFRTAIGFAIDPERNKLKKARFDKTSLAGLLGKYDLRLD
jgi:uncharacterized protein YjbI with pentapeptide repeats